jgi:nicotinate-nucleotide adenylyltransferase
MRVIFGGTFDPVHVGHLRMAMELGELLGDAFPSASKPDLVDLLPCYEAVHKSGVAATPEQRKEMLKLSIPPESVLRLDERELRREAPSYTVDTLRELRLELGGEPLVLAMGSDSAISMPSWKEVEVYAQLCHVIVIRRPGDSSVFSNDFLCSVGFECASAIEQLNESASGLVFEVELKLLDISSSDIRTRVSEGRSIRYLVSGAVEQYICDNALYTKTLGG